MTKPECPHCFEPDIAFVTYQKVTGVSKSGKITKSKEKENEEFLCYSCDTEFDMEELVEATFGEDEEDEEVEEDEDEEEEAA